ncbi:hypothetical protein Ppro_3394 [Pelobacter propionicus DSM 2379]|uniref:O-antigen ligase-related domain-containing protein n=2 Tax=Pelobacter propionicus TaxID=29543 RepID=A1AUG6_PELPD|nr:hypothetical protein Ppro_3394 [Pelobacter propionicus DSM 2379]
MSTMSLNRMFDIVSVAIIVTASLVLCQVPMGYLLVAIVGVIVSIYSVKTVKLELFSVVFFAFATIYFASIPKFGPLPFSLKYLLMLALFLTFWRHDGIVNMPRPITSIGPFAYYWLGLICLSLATMNVGSLMPPAESLFLVIFALFFVRSARERGIFLTRFVAVLTTISACWYLLNIAFFERIYTIRQILYASYVDANDPRTLVAMLRPTGLTFNHHIMGYHMTAAMVLSSLLSLLETEFRWKWFWRASLPLVILATVLTAQRSVIPAVVAAFMVFALIEKKLKVLVAIFAVSILIGGGLYFSIKTAEEFGVKSLTSRFEEKDVGSRLGWQLTAVKTVVSNPFSLKYTGRSWEDEATELGADYSQFGDKVQAVHNSYLGVMLNYGWAGVAIVLMSLVYLFSVITEIIKQYLADKRQQPFALVTCLAMLALSLQALFHNASVFTNETVSCLIFASLICWKHLLPDSVQQPLDTTRA